MQELQLVKKKSTDGISIAGESSVTDRTLSNVTSNSDGSFSFTGAGSSYSYLRIPYATTPYPVGEDMEFRMKGRILTQGDANPIYMLGRWTTIAGLGEICFKRTSTGAVQLDIGPITEQSTQSTTGSIALNTDFDFYWRHTGTTMYAELNGVNIFNATGIANRQVNNDWVLGGYLNTSNQPSSGPSKSSWLLYSLTINRLTS